MVPLERHLSRTQTVCRHDADLSEIDAADPSLLLQNSMAPKGSLYCASALQRLQPDPTEWETWCSVCSPSPLQPDRWSAIYRQHINRAAHFHCLARALAEQVTSWTLYPGKTRVTSGSSTDHRETHIKTRLRHRTSHLSSRQCAVVRSFCVKTRRKQLADLCTR